MEERERFIEALYGEHAYKLRRFCQRFVNYRREYDDVVEECVQDVFICAYRCYDTLKEHPNVQAWLYKTCNYRMRDKVKQLRRRLERTAPEEMIAYSAFDENVERWMEKESAREDVEAFFASLEGRDRTVLYERYISGKSIKEISQRFGMNENTVKVTLLRLRRRAKKFLSQSRNISLLFVTLFILKALY